MDNKHPNHTQDEESKSSEQEPPALDAVEAPAPAPSLFNKSPAVSLTPFQGVAPVPKPELPSAHFEQGIEDSDQRTDNLAEEEISSLELVSLAEESPSTLDEEEGDDPTEMLSPEDVALALERSDVFEDVEPEVLEVPRPAFVPKFSTPSLKTPESTPPALGALSAPNPFLRPSDAPKRTLMGMRAPTIPAATPAVTPRAPQSAPPAPGTGAPALTNRAMSFGAEHAYSSTRMPQPQGLPLDPLSTSGHLMPTPAPTEQPEEDFHESEATAIYHGEPSSPHLSAPTPGSAPGFTTEFATSQPDAQAHEFQEAEATIVGDSPAGMSLDGEDLDDDFAEQKTEVIQSPFEQEAIMPKLRVAEGPMTGQEFLLTGLRSTIGRGNNNSVMVEDLAMSRLHFEIIRNADDSYLLRDLGSANGTGLNGTRVKESVLYHGDRMEAGKSIIIFEHDASPARPQRHMIAVANATVEGQPLEPIAPPMQSGPDDHTRLAALQIDQSTRMFTRVALGAGALCIPLCFLLIFAIISSSDKPGDKPPVATSEPASGDGAQRTRQAANLFLKGAEATKSRSWDEAKQYFEEAKRVDEGIDIGPQLNRITREKEAMEHLEEARKLQEAEQIIEVATKIPGASVYFDEAQKLIRLNRQDEVTILHQKTLALLQEEKLDEAEASLKELAALSPEHKGIATLTQDIQGRRDVIAAALKKQEEEAAAAAKANGIFKDTSSGSGGTSHSKADLQEGYSYYKSKKFRYAKSSFKKAGGKKGRDLANHTDTVNLQWKRGTDAIASGNWTGAISALEKARSADRRINKAHRKSIGKSLAEAYGNAGLGKLQKKDYRQARKYLASGEKLGVSESSLSKLSRGLEDEAKKIYVRAVNKKKSDPDAALQLCRKIMLMLPSSSATYKKAQKLIFDL